MPRQRILQAGFTLVEIMIVVAIIGLLAAVAVPNFVKARQNSQRNACINNLRQIEGAKERWAIENRKGPTASVSKAGVNSYIKAGAPRCPAGGTYSYRRVDRDPKCSISDHRLSALDEIGGEEADDP